MRYLAMHAFALHDSRMGLSSVAGRAVDELLEMAVTEDPTDPMGKLKNELCQVLFSSGRHGKAVVDSVGIDNVPRPELIAARLDLPLGEVIPILDDLETHLTFLFRDEEGHVLWAYPMTASPTPHRVFFSSGEQIYAA